MHLLGLFTATGGFPGIIALGVPGVTRSLPAALITHGILFLIFVAFSIQRSGGLTEWRNPKMKARYSVQHSIIILLQLPWKP